MRKTIRSRSIAKCRECKIEFMKRYDCTWQKENCCSKECLEKAGAMPVLDPNQVKPIKLPPVRRRKKKPRRVRAKERRSKDVKFYRSREWLELRYAVLKHYGAKCMLCGSKNPPMHVDHIKPRSLFPLLALEFSNLQVLCKDCNKGKSNWDDTDWRS